ncbi:MAG: 4-hydroxy-tetrahydrodipicolinate reductase [Desulfovibrio sp.]|nr:4-hydroxy-tetrahydrodipicolinate reductase [Desulfovibrio sp.]
MGTVKIVVMGAKGRMGQTIAQLVQTDPALELVGVMERGGGTAGLECYNCVFGADLDVVLPQVPGAVVVDFTSPESSVRTAQGCAMHGNPVVCGTTGLTADQQAKMAEAATSTPVLWAPNMSVGVNTLLKVLPQLTRMLGEAYDIEVMEIHHNQKKDAPSGTALKLAECLARARDWDLQEAGAYCREGIIGARPHKEIGVQTLRGGDVVGVHTVYFLGPGERIEITHQAHSRTTFAQGALRAAKWLAGQKPGKLYGIGDIL